MKKNYIIKSMSLFVFLAFTLQTTIAQIRIVEVDPSTNTIKLHNFGSASNPQDISSYWFCSRFGYQAVSTCSLLSGSTNLSVGSDVVLRTTTLNLNETSADVGFYSSASFGSSTAMEDFMQYGAGGIGRENVAVAKGIWAAGTFIQDAPPYEYIGNGTQSGGGAQNGAAFWDTLLSVDTFESYSGFSVSPNPASSIVRINLSANLNDGTITLYNILGKEVMTKMLLGNNEETLDVSNFDKGIYLLKIESGIQSQTKRIIIK